jgi:predicted RNA-binding protein YlxR (DUF448 family)
MKPQSLVSERTCIGCRRRAPVAELARLALSSSEGDDTRVVVWAARGSSRPPGRGASLHPDPACLRAALKGGAFGRAFRAGVGNINEADFLGQLTAATAALRTVNRKKP